MRLVCVALQKSENETRIRPHLGRAGGGGTGSCGLGSTHPGHLCRRGSQASPFQTPTGVICGVYVSQAPTEASKNLCDACYRRAVAAHKGFTKECEGKKLLVCVCVCVKGLWLVSGDSDGCMLYCRPFHHLCAVCFEAEQVAAASVSETSSVSADTIESKGESDESEYYDECQSCGQEIKEGGSEFSRDDTSGLLCGECAAEQKRVEREMQDAVNLRYGQLLSVVAEVGKQTGALRAEVLSLYMVQNMSALSQSDSCVCHHTLARTLPTVERRCISTPL